jgi:hypothetical protein
MISKAPPIFSKLGREPAQAPANFSKDKAWISLDFFVRNEAFSMGYRDPWA